MAKEKKVKKTKKVADETTVSFLLDQSGSMQMIKDDVIGGFNGFIGEQKKQPGKCGFIFTLFDSTSVDTKEYTDVADVPELTDATYKPGVATPLLDAIGQTIRTTEKTNPKGKVLLVVFTDGYENASKEFKKDTLKKLVAEKEGQGWDFIFMGADMDAYGEAGGIGFAGGHTVSMDSASSGQTLMAATASVSSYRSGDENYMSHLKVEEENQKVSDKTTGGSFKTIDRNGR